STFRAHPSGCAFTQMNPRDFWVTTCAGMRVDSSPVVFVRGLRTRPSFSRAKFIILRYAQGSRSDARRACFGGTFTPHSSGQFDHARAARVRAFSAPQS
ncbi:MAG TPA: hypothetical protein VMI93_13745, partial [Candidatus Solibacter sp.]|nr:hypothetical protein [Candidatus Solibacter sp.]